MASCEKKTRILNQLLEMFGSVFDQEEIEAVCENCTWNLQYCVDNLIMLSNEVAEVNSAKEANSSPTKAQTSLSKNLANTAKNAQFSEDTQQKYQILNKHGAISKNNSYSNILISNNNGKNNNNSRDEYAYNVGATCNGNLESTQNTGSNSQKSSVLSISQRQLAPPQCDAETYQRLCDVIKSGICVLILLRGAPGSGKTTLAEQLISACVPLDDERYKISDFIFSADDYFMDKCGRYNYKSCDVPLAHEWNQERVRAQASNSWSPIIIDNTNMQVWEMLPYAKIGVQFGYMIEILEPTTSWRFSITKLAMKNRHQVPREGIQRSLDRYQKTNVNDLLKNLKYTQYTVKLPVYRLVPPIELKMPAAQELIDENSPILKENGEQSDVVSQQENSMSVYKEPDRIETNFETQTDKILKANGEGISTDSLSWGTYIEADAPKEKRECNRSGINLPSKEDNAWKPYEEAAPHYWFQQQQELSMNQDLQLTNTPQGTEQNKNLIDLLRECDVDKTVQAKPLETGEKLFLRHRVGCPNEEPGFMALRQIYPNKELSGLWDLFLKCKGELDWAVDILLKEDEFSLGLSRNITSMDASDEFKCNCNVSNATLTLADQQLALYNNHNDIANNDNNDNNATSSPHLLIKPQRQNRSSRRVKHELAAEVKQELESRFVLSEEQYSTHTLKIRNNRYNKLSNGTEQENKTPEESNPIDPNEPGIEDEDSNESDSEQELIEIDLGSKFVKQLNQTFRSEYSLGERLPEQLITNVFMPRRLARQLYMLWMESVYNQMEENRQKMLNEDEQLARLLANTNYQDCKKSPQNENEVLDMELAWSIYTRDLKQDSAAFMINRPTTDIATHLTKMKLCETYPNIPKDVVLEVFKAHGNSYSKTLQVLGKPPDKKIVTQEELIQRVMHENELLNKQVAATQKDSSGGFRGASTSTQNNSNRNDSIMNSPTRREEVKRSALMAFERTRNLAAHHAQLKAECYAKAREAIRNGYGGAALYYSQVAKLHLKKIDYYNQYAANCIIDVHKYTLNDPDLLDLHYLHVMEAICCLDIFLDKHITGLRSLNRQYKNVFVITGRGLHSVGGVSTIKNKVKSRLKDRSLKWSEVNPGLLRVKIFAASRHSRQF